MNSNPIISQPFNYITMNSNPTNYSTMNSNSNGSFPVSAEQSEPFPVLVVNPAIVADRIYICVMAKVPVAFLPLLVLTEI